MSWAATLPAVLVSLLVVFGPGLLWGWVLGLRRLTLLALAGPSSITAVVVSAEAAALVGIDWSLLALAAVTLAVALLLRVVRYRFGQLLQRATSAPAASWRTVLVSWAVSAVPIAALMIWIIGVPENIAQSHDNTFHLNALRYIDDTSNASSLTLGYLGTREGTFYPAAWHAVVALVMTTGIPLTAAVNVTNLVVVTGIWSMGCLFLVSRVTSERALPLLVAAVLSTAYSSFPYLLLEFGVVYPYLLSIAMLPAALGLVIQLVGAGVPGSLRPGACALLLVGIMPGLLLAHPSALLGLLALGAPAVLAVVLRRARSGIGRRARFTALAGGAAFLLVTALLWATVRPARSGAENWVDMGNAGSAVVGVLFHGPLGRPAALLVTILTVAGAVVVLQMRRQRWVLGMYLVAAALFVIGNWQQAPELRWMVTGPWYNDYFRISALLPVAGILVASMGGMAVAGAALDRLRQLRSARGTPEPSWYVPVVAALLVLAGLALAPWFAVQRGVSEAAQQHRYTDDSRLLTSDELELLQRLPGFVPPDAVTVGTPLTGASLAYAFADRRTLLPHGTSPATADARLIFAELDTMRQNSRVCDAVRRTHLGFVLDFGSASVSGGDAPTPPGLRELTLANGFELVDRQGDASLYRIVGCPTTSQS